MNGTVGQALQVRLSRNPCHKPVRSSLHLHFADRKQARSGRGRWGRLSPGAEGSFAPRPMPCGAAVRPAPPLIPESDQFLGPQAWASPAAPPHRSQVPLSCLPLPAGFPSKLEIADISDRAGSNLSIRPLDSGRKHELELGHAGVGSCVLVSILAV